MANTIKITCSNASFVDKHNPLHNYSKFDTLSAGLVNTRLSGFHLFKSILSFDVPKIEADKIKNAYLFIFINKLQYSGNAPENIGICGNYSNVNTSTVLWNTFPTEKFTPTFHLNLPKSSSDSYIKINITEILKELCINDEYYNLILCPIDSSPQIITVFSSPSSDNPPYLKIEYDKPETYPSKEKIDGINDKLNLINSLYERSTAQEEAEKTNRENILSLLNNVNLLNKEIVDLKDNIFKLNSEVLNIKNSINDMCAKSESVSNNPSNCNLDEINNKLSDLSASINQISNTLSDLTIDPLN